MTIQNRLLKLRTMQPDKPFHEDEDTKPKGVVAYQVIRAASASFFAYIIALAVGGGIRPEAAAYYGLLALVFLFFGLRINPHGRAVIYAASLVAFSCVWVSILLLV